MKVRSKKNKGQRLQKEIRESLLNHFSDKIQEGDIKVAISGESGVDIKLSPLAEKIIPFDIEIKNQEKAKIWEWINQASSNCKENRIPLVVFRRNRSKTYAIIEWKHLLKLIK